MLMKCSVQMRGPGPSETIVVVETDSGMMEIIVDVDSVKDDRLLFVESVHKRNGSTLVELPRESTSGQTRVWVPTKNTMQESVV
jgi:hypothetical protein